MKRYLLLLLVTLFTLVLNAQVEQPIVVREYQEKAQKTPLGGVGVTVTNAGATMTDAQGNASLRFRTLHAGDRVQVRRIELSGYEVFNQDALDQWTIAPSTPFQIVLCRSDKFRALREQYQRVASASYDKQFKADRARLDKERKKSKLLEEEYQRRLQELQDQYDEQLEHLDNYIDQFARIDLSALSRQEQELIDLVQAGKTDKAIALYESRDYLGQYARESRELAEIEQAQQRLADVEAQKKQEREAVAASIDRQINTYQLAGGMENWAKITALRKAMADADTTNYLAVLKFVNHAVAQGLFSEVEQYATMILRMKDLDPSERAKIYFLLGVNDSQLSQFDRAIARFQQSLDILEPQRAQGNFENDGLYGEVYFALLNTYKVLFEFEKGAALPDVSSILEKEAEEHPKETLYLSNLITYYGLRAIVLLNISEDASQLKECLSLLQKSLDLCKTHCTTTKEEDCLRYIACYENFLNYYEALEDHESSLQCLESSILFARILYQHNPESHRFVLFEILSNLADSYVVMDRLDDAEPIIAEALPLLPDLEKQNAAGYAVNKMALYDTVALFYEKKGDAEHCRQYARLCMETYQTLVDEYKEAYLFVKERWQDK